MVHAMTVLGGGAAEKEEEKKEEPEEESDEVRLAFLQKHFTCMTGASFLGKSLSKKHG